MFYVQGNSILLDFLYKEWFFCKDPVLSVKEMSLFIFVWILKISKAKFPGTLYIQWWKPNVP